MRNLILFLIRNSAFFVFLFFQLVCLFLTVQFNSYQNDIFSYSMGRLNNGVSARLASIEDYIALDQRLDSVMHENARLQSLLSSLSSPDSTDTERNSNWYQWIPAKIIDNSIIHRDNYFIIDKGTKDSVFKDMGVVSHAGLVGITLRCSDNYCLGLSMLHSKSSISARINRSGHFGALEWDYPHPRRFLLKGVPRHAKIEQGDSVRTSGYSQFFPMNLWIGEITDFRLNRGENHYHIEVEGGTDFSKLKDVFVIKNTRATEILNLKNSIRNNE